jgi:hypothetical protein
MNTSSLKNKKLINYLTKYPLFTSKYLNYQDWKKAYDLFYKKEQKNKKIYEEIKNLKLNMNKSRKIYTWNHLIHFY